MQLTGKERQYKTYLFEPLIKPYNFISKTLQVVRGKQRIFGLQFKHHSFDLPSDIKIALLTPGKRFFQDVSFVQGKPMYT